ncbi:hypothetical protein CRENBAI_020560 [Crenichthys baileyi]|uniref:Voltage-dependent calcium channel gamma-4 subunit n=1 Tax=Crenichthys baileyi TaxID=28760 RepID=A0AAV9SNW7_9TELE
MSPDSDLDVSRLAQLSALLLQHDSLLSPPTSSGSAIKSSCQASLRLTSSTLAPAAHSCLFSACSFSSDLLLSNRSSRTSTFDVFFYSSHPLIFSASPALHSSHSTSPELASNLATSASSSPLYWRPARSLAPPTGVHLANARPSLLLSINQGSCYRINHFPDDNDYDTDSSEYLLRIVRASSVFPILSTALLMLGGLCVGMGRVYNKTNNVLLSAGILFVAAGLSNIIGIIVYISSNAGDPSDKRDDDKKYTYSYGWSFYFGALSFIVAETVAVLVINIYIEKNKEVRWKARREFIRSLSSSSPYSRIPSFRYRRRTSRASSHSTEASRENSPVVGMKGAPSSSGPLDELSMYALARDSVTENTYSPEHEGSAEFLQVHNCFSNDLKDGVNRRTTPVMSPIKLLWSPLCGTSQFYLALCITGEALLRALRGGDRTTAHSINHSRKTHPPHVNCSIEESVLQRTTTPAETYFLPGLSGMSLFVQLG